MIVLLYATGVLMLLVRFPNPLYDARTRFGRLLMVKVALAAIVLVCFITA